MIRQQSTRKRSRGRLVLNILLILLELLAFIGIFVADYTSRHKMGMQRHMVYLNAKWEKNYPLGLIRLIAIFLILLFIGLLILDWMRGRASRKWLMLVSLGLNILGLAFIIIVDRDMNRAYYLMAIGIFLGLIFQNTIYRINR